ncbi:MAG: insulinase family protein [Kofleriaceae bacterium]
MWRFVVVVFLSFGCWGAPRPASPARETTIVLAVDQVELANGLKLIVVAEPAAREVAVTVRYATGSIADPPGREGLAHLVEHLMFEHVRDGEALFDFLERSALGFTGFTTPDATVYQQHAPPARLSALLALEQARLLQSCDDIPASAFVRAREIVRNELLERQGNARVAQALHAGVFPAPHPLGRAESTPQSVAAITREEACAFAAAHYAPNNAVVVISGPIGLREIQPTVEQTLGRVPRGPPVVARPLAPASSGRSVTIEAPTDRAWFVLAWPMPATANERARLRAVAGMAATLVEARINGTVAVTELGAGAASAIAIAVAPSSEISFVDAITATKRVIAEIGPWFGSGLYERAKHRAVYRLAASFDSTLARDMRFASDAARGEPVRPAEEARVLQAMSRDDARDLVRARLHPDKATVVTLRPAALAQATGGVTSTFREHRRRRAEDPSEAQRPALAVATADPRARSRTLPNGLTVVLLPLATMPTVDIRLVFPTGTGDEASDQRGIAVLAAHAIEAELDGEMFQFLQSGGALDADVGFDTTELAVTGLAANLDILLFGLAATVREGMYLPEGVRAEITRQQVASTATRADRTASAAWREALYGGDHPYRHAGDWAHASKAAYQPKALARFQRSRYQPTGATLIIAGQFAVEAADRWVDYYFKEWTGAPPARREREATLRPLAFAQRQAGAQLAVHIGFAAPSGDHAARAVVVEMLEGAIADVREQLAASYGLHASLVTRRLLTTIELRGSIDAGRATDALALLRDRLAQLRVHDDATASLFVSARRRVLARWATADQTASAIADTARDDLRAPRSLERVRVLTLAQIQPQLAELELSRAAILLRGSERALREAYTSIGRSPTALE